MADQEKILNGTVKVRQSGGTPDTDEVQIYHDGTDGVIETQSGILSIPTNLTISEGVVIGAPTGGNQGTGTINVEELYIDGVLVEAGGGGDPVDSYFNSLNTITTINDLTSTSLTNSYQYTGANRAVVTSIHITNKDSSEHEIDVLVTDDSQATDFYIGRQIPIPPNSSLEFALQAKVLETDDLIKLQADTANNFEVAVTSGEVDNTDLFNVIYTAGGAAASSLQTIYTESNANGSVIESINIANTEGDATANGVLVTINIVDGSDSASLVAEIILPPKAAIELCQKPKFLPQNATIQVLVSDANRCDVYVSGRQL